MASSLSLFSYEYARKPDIRMPLPPAKLLPNPLNYVRPQVLNKQIQSLQKSLPNEKLYPEGHPLKI